MAPRREPAHVALPPVLGRGSDAGNAPHANSVPFEVEFERVQYEGGHHFATVVEEAANCIQLEDALHVGVEGGAIHQEGVLLQRPPGRDLALLNGAVLHGHPSSPRGLR